MASTTRNYLGGTHRRGGSQFGGSTNASSSRRNVFGLAGSTQLKNTFA